MFMVLKFNHSFPSLCYRTQKVNAEFQKNREKPMPPSRNSTAVGVVVVVVVVVMVVMAAAAAGAAAVEEEEERSNLGLKKNP
jgi:hypothetical protein